MVQLSPSPLGAQAGGTGSMKPAGPPASRPAHGPPQPAAPSAASPCQVYETYVDNGLICLKHKIRNIEKKKLKLEDYKDRLRNGEQLNPDQLEAVERYEEVLHNLEFAKELQKTFSGLSQDLLKAQRKAQRREHLVKLEAEKKKLSSVLRVQFVLQSLAQERVRADLLAGLHGALCLPGQELDYLLQFSKLTCLERRESLSVEDQMEQSSLYFWDLLEGSEKAVVGTTYKHLKDLLDQLLDSGYFETIHLPKNPKEKGVPSEDETFIKPETENQLLQLESTRESESLMDAAQPEIESQEFLNRRYLAAADYSQEQGGSSWVADYAGEPGLPKCWEACSDAEDQKREATGQTRESPGRRQRVSKPAAPPDGSRRRVPELGPVMTLPVDRGTQGLSRPKLPPGQWKPDGPAGEAGGLPDGQKQRGPPPQPWPQGEQEPARPAAEAWSPTPGRERNCAWEMGPEPRKHPFLPPSQLASKAWGASPAALLPRNLTATEPKDVPPPLCQQAGPPAPALPKEPLPAEEKLQDLMTQMQGTCDFMQDSVLDLDKPPSAVAAVQPPPASPSSLAVSSAQSLASQSDFLQEPLQATSSPIECSTSICLDAVQQQTSGPDAESSEATGAPGKPLSADLAPCQDSEQAFQSPPASASVIVPFQAMQPVFHGRVPLAPRKEQDARESPFAADGSQSFSTASTQTPPQCCPLPAIHLEPAVLPQDMAGYPEGALPVSGGGLAFFAAPAGAFPRPSPPFIGSRPPVRGCSRGGRLPAGSSRSPGGYKGFDPYRGASSVPNGNYAQLPFQVREFSTALYPPRDNFLQSYKRGGMPGCPRTSSRAAAGWSDSSQVSSPDHREETFTSGDSGHGDSRSLTPAEMPAALLPLHVCPLPPQMRVAFSAARTSNLTPGSLDQPVVFDLLLSNLGQTFDLQLGRFACPADGTYVFIFHLLKLAVNVPLYVNLMRNEEVLVSAYANDGAPDHETASNHAVLQLCRGDQVWLRLHRGAIYGSSWKYSTFSGYLLYQD